MFFIFFNLCNILVVHVGHSLNNKYTRLASTRAANLALNFDIVISALINYLLFLTNNPGLENFYTYKHEGFGLVTLFPIMTALLITFLMEVGRAPFDLVEAESEIIMGFHSEYSGFMFALFILGEYVHIFLFSYLTYNILV